MDSLSRRSFVKSSAAAGLASAFAVQPPSVLGANEKVNIGSIGLRSQGMSVTRKLIQTGEANIVALCDVDANILREKAAEAERHQGSKPKTHGDFRALLEDDSIDAVVIGTPDHWHAIQALAAMEAGKDVYVEKPCAHNITECRVMAQAAKKHGRIVQHGTQQRSGDHFKEAKEYVKSGKLGKIAMSRTWAVLGRGSIGTKPDGQAPDHLDYKMWLGPAPSRPYNENRSHYNWRFFWDYGTGDMGNWGVHWIDIALWTLDLGWPEAIASSGGKFVFTDDKEVPDTQMTLYEYPDLTLFWELRMWSKQGIEGRGVGTAFYGEEQTLVIDRGGWQAYAPNGRKVAEGRPGNDMSLAHAQDFIDGVKSRKAPIGDIENGHISAAVAVFGNVAFHAGEKVRYNPETNSLGREEMNHLLTREYHNGWDLPEKPSKILGYDRM